MTKLSKAAVPVLAALAALAFASCGDEETEDVTSGPATLMPADAPFYLEAVVSPDGEQEEQLNALTEKLGELPLVGQITNPGDLIKGLIEESAAGSGVSLDFAEDVDPWLGKRIGASFLSVEDGSERFVVALETTDEDAARASLEQLLEEDAVDNEEQTYEGVSYFTSGAADYGVGVFSDHLVLATIDEFQAAIDTAAGSESLADSDQLGASTEGLSEDRLATMLLDLGRIGELASESPEELEKFEQVRSALPELFEEPSSIALGVDERSIWMDSVTPEIAGQPELTGTEALAAVPADAFAAIGVGSVGGLAAFATDLYDRIAESGVEIHGYPKDGIASAFEEKTGVPLDDATAAIGDGTLWVRGDLPDGVEIGTQVAVEDEETVTALVDELRRQAEREEGANAIGPPLDSAADGFSADFTVSDPAFELELFNLELSDGSLRLGFFHDRDEAESFTPTPKETLGESEAFGRAEEVLGSEFELIGLADLAPILDAALADAGLESDVLSPLSNPEAMAANFIADKFDVLALGLKSADGRVLQRIALGIGE